MRGQPGDLAGVIGKQRHRADAKRLQHRRRQTEITFIGLEAQPRIGIDGIEALVLQCIGPQLVEQADAAAFLLQIKQNTAARVGADRRQRRVQLRPAITFQTAEHITGQARRMQADQHWPGA